MAKHSAACRNLALAAALLAFPVHSAIAQDVSEVAARLKTLATKQGVDLAWSNVTGSASTMVLEGVTVKPAADQDGMAIGNITLSGVTEVNGGYMVDTLTTAPFSMTEQALVVDISPLTIHGLSIPADDASDPMSSFTMYRSASLDSLSVKMNGKTAFEMHGLAGTITPPEGGAPMQFAGGVAQFGGDLSLIDDQSVKGYLQALGYSRLDGNIKVTGAWQPADGRWSMSQYDIAVNDVGTLGMTVDLGGLTPEFLQAANAISTSLSEAPEGADKSAQQAQLMGMLPQVTFYGARVRFSDASLTSRALNMAAMLMGATPADVVNMAKGAIPAAMMEMRMMELASAISPAVNAFLDDPKSIEIVAAPPAPVSFAEIGAVSMAASDDSAATTSALWSLLGISVVANR